MKPESISVNEFYHRAIEKNIAGLESVRLTLDNYINPMARVTVKIIMDYNLKLDAKYSLDHNAIGAVAVFKNLSDNEFENIVTLASSRFSNGKKAEQFSISELLKRNDILFISKDEKIMNHPLIKLKVGNIDGEIYSGGDTPMHKEKDLLAIKESLDSGSYMSDRLDGSIHKSWNGKNNNPDISYP
jgi:hypothetical protein